MPQCIKKKRLRSPVQLIKESKKSDTFDGFGFLSSDTVASIITNVGLSVGPWKKIQNQKLKKSKNFDYSDYFIIGDS